MPRRTNSRYTHGHAAFILIPLFSSLGASVSLSDFNPKLSNLPSQCESVYTQSIAGCGASDFAGQNPCSQSCANGLQAISSAVNSACAKVQLPGGDVISAFKGGSGVKALCPNINNGGATSTANTANNPGFVSTVSFTSTLSPSETPTSSSTTASSSPTTSTSTTIATTSSSSSSTSSTSMSTISSTLITSTSTAPTLSTPMTSIVMDTSAAPPTNPSQSAALESMMQSLTSAAPPIRTSASSDRSGGGSPFDISAARPNARAQGVAAVVLGAMLVGAMLTL